MNRVALISIRFSKQHAQLLRQSYCCLMKKALMMSGRYRHAKQLQRASEMENYLQLALGSVILDVRRRLKDGGKLKGVFAETFYLMQGHHCL